jgi:hypothetical protein
MNGEWRKKAVLLWGAGALLGMIAGGARAEAPTVRVDQVVAYVNEHAITDGDVKRMLDPEQVQQWRRQLSDREFEKKLKAQSAEALDFLIERRLALDAYEAQEMRLPEWAVDGRAQDIVRTVYQGDRNRLIRELAANRMTFDQWRDEVVKTSMIVAMMRSTAVGQGVAVAPGRIRAYYETQGERFHKPSAVRMRLIALGAGQGDEARRLRAAALAGEDFATLARRHSRDAKSASGGDWGWVNPADLRPELAQAVRDLPAGKISEPVTTEDDTYLVKIEERKDGERTPFAEAQKQIEQILMREEAERRYREWIGRLKQDAYVWRRDES